MNEYFSIYSLRKVSDVFVHGIMELTVEWGDEINKKMRNTKLYAKKEVESAG